MATSELEVKIREEEIPVIIEKIFFYEILIRHGNKPDIASYETEKFTEAERAYRMLKPNHPVRQLYPNMLAVSKANRAIQKYSKDMELESAVSTLISMLRIADSIKWGKKPKLGRSDMDLFTEAYDKITQGNLPLRGIQENSLAMKSLADAYAQVFAYYQSAEPKIVQSRTA